MYSSSGGHRFFLKALAGRSSVFARRLSHTATISKFSIIYSKTSQKFFRVQQKFHFKSRGNDFWIRDYTTTMKLYCPSPQKKQPNISDEDWNKLFGQAKESVQIQKIKTLEPDEVSLLNRWLNSILELPPNVFDKFLEFYTEFYKQSPHPSVTKQFLDNIRSLFKCYRTYAPLATSIQTLTEKFHNTIRLTVSPEELRKRRQQLNTAKKTNHNDKNDKNVSQISTLVNSKGKFEQPLLNGNSLDLDHNHQIANQSYFNEQNQNLIKEDVDPQITPEDKMEKELWEMLKVQISYKMNESFGLQKTIIDDNDGILKSLREVSEEKTPFHHLLPNNSMNKYFEPAEETQLPSTKYKVVILGLDPTVSKEKLQQALDEIVPKERPVKILRIERFIEKHRGRVEHIAFLHFATHDEVETLLDDSIRLFGVTINGIRCQIVSVESKRDLYIKTRLTHKDDVVRFLNDAEIPKYKSITFSFDDAGTFSGDFHLTFESHEDAYQAKNILENKAKSSSFYRNIFVSWSRPLMGTMKRLQKERQELLEEKAKLIDLVRKKISLADLLQDKIPLTDFRLSSVLFTHISKVLEIAGYDKREGSRLLGVSCHKLSEMIKQLKREGYPFPKVIDKYVPDQSENAGRTKKKSTKSSAMKSTSLHVTPEEKEERPKEGFSELSWEENKDDEDNDVEGGHLKKSQSMQQRRRVTSRRSSNRKVQQVASRSHSASKVFETQFVSK